MTINIFGNDGFCKKIENIIEERKCSNFHFFTKRDELYGYIAQRLSSNPFDDDFYDRRIIIPTDYRINRAGRTMKEMNFCTADSLTLKGNNFLIAATQELIKPLEVVKNDPQEFLILSRILNDPIVFQFLEYGMIVIHSKWGNEAGIV